MVMDWYPFLRPIFRRLPSKVIGIQDNLIRLKNLEEKLWISLKEEAKKEIEEGTMNESERSRFALDIGDAKNIRLLS